MTFISYSPYRDIYLYVSFFFLSYHFFLGEMVGITLNCNHVLQIHRKKPLGAKFEVAFVSLV